MEIVHGKYLKWKNNNLQSGLIIKYLPARRFEKLSLLDTDSGKQTVCFRVSGFQGFFPDNDGNPM